MCQAQRKATRDVQMSDRSPWSLSLSRGDRHSPNFDTSRVLLLNRGSDIPYWNHLGRRTSSLSRQSSAGFVDLPLNSTLRFH